MSHALETFENGQTAFASARGARAVFAPGNKQKAFSVFGALAGV